MKIMNKPEHTIFQLRHKFKINTIIIPGNSSTKVQISRDEVVVVDG